MHTALRTALCVTVATLAACGSETTPPSSSDGGACTPDRARWSTSVRAQVERQCGTCHGTAPSYGAPYTLLDYDALLRPVAGARPVDRIVARLTAGTMPPTGTPAPTDDVSRAIVQWASCGAQTPPTGRGLRATRPLFRSPAQAPTGMETWELRAGGYAVAPDVTDRYQCFTFTFPGTADRFIRRFELAADRREVLHHVVLLRDAQRTAPTEPFECLSMPSGSDYLYAWAPGQDALQFPEGGLRITPGQRLVMQIHYNNGQGLRDVRDNSGLRLYHSSPSGTEYGMVALGPVSFQVPPRTTSTAQSGCTITRESRLLTGMPHMHGYGTDFVESITRATGGSDPLITLQGWRFDAQLFYDFGTALHPGDRIETTCTYNNTTATAVRSGSRTADEMCFNFAYVTPPPTERYCDQAHAPGDALAYAPGMCAQPAATSEVPTAMGRAMVGAAPALHGTTLPDGRWELTGVTWYLNTASAAGVAIDLAETTLTSRGQLWTSSGRLTADFVTRLALVLMGGARISRDIPVSASGTYTSATSPIELSTNCAAGPMMFTSLDYAVEGDTLTLGNAPTMISGIMITPRYQFRRVM